MINDLRAIHDEAVRLSAEHGIGYGQAILVANGDRQLVAVVDAGGAIIGDDATPSTVPDPRRHPSASRLDDLDPVAAEAYEAEPFLLPPASSIEDVESRMHVSLRIAGEVVALDRRIAELEGPPHPEFPSGRRVAHLDFRHLPDDELPQPYGPSADADFERDKRRYAHADLGNLRHADHRLQAELGFDIVYDEWRERQQMAINGLVHLRLNTIARGQTDHALAQRRARESAEFEKRLEDRKREERDAQFEREQRSAGRNHFGW